MWWLCLVARTLAQETPDTPSIGFSAGTGPRPLQSLTLGLTGLGARMLIPAGEVVVPYVGVAATLGSVASFEEGSRNEAFVTGGSAVHGSAGVRFDLAERQAGHLVPYVLTGALVGRVSGWTTDKGGDSRDATGSTTFGGLAGLGLDAFVARPVSVGAEVGGFGAVSTASSKFRDGSVSGKDEEVLSTTLVTTFTSVMLTVWR